MGGLSSGEKPKLWSASVFLENFVPGVSVIS